MQLVRWQPNSAFKDFHDEFDRLIERMFGGEVMTPTASTAARWNDGAFLPPVNVVDKGERIEVKVEVPGLEADDVKITCENNMLSIAGEKRHEEKSEKDSVHRFECRYGAFRRVIPLPVEVNAGKAEATFKNGVLSVNLPKAEAAKPKEVKIAIK